MNSLTSQSQQFNKLFNTVGSQPCACRWILFLASNSVERISSLVNVISNMKKEGIQLFKNRKNVFLLADGFYILFQLGIGLHLKNYN